jgi:hypothetical protein
MSALAPCPSCHRHVRIAESACPFCGATVALEPVISARIGAQRLGRAAIFTFGAVAIASTSAGCSNAMTPASDAGNDAYYGSIGDVYGAPADAGPYPEDAGTDSGLSAAYGAPPIDAASEDAGSAALYGAPPDAQP